MYQLGIRVHKRHKVALYLLAVAILLTAAFFSYRALHLTPASQTHIKNSSGITGTYDSGEPKQVAIDEPLFSLELPAGWAAAIPVPGAPVPVQYYFKSSSADARQLAIYIDTIPTTMALNRVVSVSSKGNTLDHSNVSDNCTNYTHPTAQEIASGVAVAKWRGDDFLCDIGNYERDVVGTVSTESNNQITLTGTKSGTHKLFMVYTDNGASADYTIFYGIISSLQFK